MNRIDLEFDNLKKQGKKALVPFVTFSDLDSCELADTIVEMRNCGANIVEIGVPFSEPLADGPVIQEAYSKALKKGNRLDAVYETISLVNEKCDIPIIVMVYYNIIFCNGVEKFMDKAKEVGIDGLIVPDIPLEERGELLDVCKSRGIHLIPLVAPTSKDRIKAITNDSNGFVYCISSNGVTGERSSFNNNIQSYLDEVKNCTDLPLLLGFGISSRESVRDVKDFADGVIVGSAVVKRLDDKSAVDFIKELRDELDK